MCFCLYVQQEVYFMLHDETVLEQGFLISPSQSLGVQGVQQKWKLPQTCWSRDTTAAQKYPLTPHFFSELTCPKTSFLSMK